MSSPVYTINQQLHVVADTSDIANILDVSFAEDPSISHLVNPDIVIAVNIEHKESALIIC